MLMIGEDQRRLYDGYARLAERIGSLFRVYRPCKAENPLTKCVCELPMSFNAETFSYSRSGKFGDADYFLAFDGSKAQAGDYLKDCDRTFFVAAQQPLAPILGILCNRSVQLLRTPTPEDVVGAAGYSGLCATDDEPALGSGTGSSWIGWPCSIVIGGVRNRNTLKLPAGSSDQLGFTILLPVSVPLQFRASDVLLDDLGQRYSVAGCESSEYGWRLYGSEVHT